ncbi:MAG TPA: RICIN domain-containing protein [Actinokineospora sp.]|nr:RICIN domain-containing protein [Actinokineospora sp.]
MILLPATSAQAATGSAVSGETVVRSKVDNRVLDVFGGNADTGHWMNAYPSNGGANQKFALHPLDNGSFLFKTHSGLCLQPGSWDAWHRLRPVTQQLCNGQEQWQKWFLQPVGSAWIIKNAADSQCMDVVTSHYDGVKWLNMWPCHGAYNQLWTFDTGVNSSFSDANLKALAAKYGMTLCQQTPSTCKFDATTISTAAAGNPVCVLDVNGGPNGNPGSTYTYTETKATSTVVVDHTSTGITATVAVKVTGFDLVDAGLDVTFKQLWERTTTVSTSASDTTSRTYNTGPIPANKWGAVIVQPTVKTYTGSFRFNPGSWDQWDWGTGTQLTVQVPSTMTRVTASWFETECDGKGKSFTG